MILATKKRGRGRPKGSKNKKKVINRDDIKVTKDTKDTKDTKVAKVAKVTDDISDGSDLSSLRVFQFLGYCPSCNHIVSKNDLVSKFIYICNGCRESGRTKILKKSIDGVENLRETKKSYNKREFINDIIGTDYHDMPNLNNFDGSTYISHDKYDDDGR